MVISATEVVAEVDMSQKAEIGCQNRPSRERPLLVFVPLLLVAGLARQTSAKHSPAAANLSLKVQVDNYAEVKSQILTDSEIQVMEIFRHGGIQIIWITGPAPAGPSNRNAAVRVRAPPDVDLRLLTLCMTEKLHLRHETMGFALPCSMGEDDCVAAVFYPRVEEFAGGGLASLQRVLGCAIAHEIGHVLLGPNSHSALGIMRSAWERDDFATDARALSSLLFTDRQTELIQTVVRERVRREDATELQVARWARTST